MTAFGHHVTQAFFRCHSPDGSLKGPRGVEMPPRRAGEGHSPEPNRLKFTIQQVGLLERVNGITYYLTHYPLEVGETNNQLRSVCGHIHENIAPMANMINIGIDSPEIAFVTANFGTPLTLETVAELVDKKWEKWYYKYINDKEEYHLGNTK